MVTHMDLHFSLAGVDVAWPLLVGIGFVVGVLQGFFGVGGGWLTTPALNILGFPFVYAIGTDLAFTAGAAFVGTFRHLRLGHLDVRLAAPIGIAGIVSLEAARRLVLFLESEGVAGIVLRWAYIVFLFGVGAYILWREFWRVRPPTQPAVTRGGAGAWRTFLGAGPRVVVLQGAMTVPLAALVAAGLLVGLLAGFLGTGGGFVLVPLLIYALKVPPAHAVAASLFSVVLATGFGALGYWSVGRVELVAAGLMFGGAFVGTQLGAIATAAAPPGRLQILLGAMLLAAGLAVTLRQATWFTLSAVVMFFCAGAMCAFILWLLWRSRRSGPGLVSL